jgi:hypothetical protein
MPIRQEICMRLAAFVERSNQHLSFLLSLSAVVVLGVLALSTTTLFAQNTSPQTQTGTQPDSQAPATPAPSAPSKIPPVALYNRLEEKSIFFPDIADGTTKLSSGQKFELFVDNSISVHTITWSVLGAAVGQADNSPTGWGQGWDAYAKRFGSSMGSEASSEFFGTFMLASMLHQDPRFYSEVNPTFGHAVKYSVQRIFITRNDDGRDVTNWSGLIGPAMAEGLVNIYQPDRNRTAGDTLMRYGLEIATRAGGNMLREYWPVFYGKIHHASRPAAGH